MQKDVAKGDKMKRVVIAIAGLFMLGFSGMAPAQQQKHPAASPQVEASVRKLWEAFKNKDKATLSALLDDGFREFEEGLSTFGDKKAEINAPDEFELLKYTLSDFSIRPIGPNTALVTYLAQYEGKSGGEVSKAKSVFGEVWIFSGGHWRALYLQETYVK